MTPAALMFAARIAAVLTLAAVTLLFVSAGLLVQEARGLDVHGAGAIAAHVSSGLLAVLLGLRAWKSRSGLHAAVAASALFGLTFAQAALGSYLTMTLHVLGALIVAVLAAWLAFWTFTAATTAGDATQRP